MFESIEKTIEEILCNSQLSEISKLKEGIKETKKIANAVKKELNTCKEDNTTLKKKLLKFDKKSKEEIYWNNKYPKKTIYYAGRMIPKDVNRISVDIKDFITPNDAAIQSEIKRFNLEVNNPKKCNNDILKIYKHCRKGAYYKRDIDMEGFGEYWLFPFEYLALNKHADCEDNSHYIASTLIGAGVPEFRVRVVCGITRNGFGHSTVYVLGDDLKTWYHINSTGGHEHLDDLTKFPTTKDEKDTLGIKHVWFSFNNLFSWNKFDTKIARNSFKKEKSLIIK